MNLIVLFMIDYTIFPIQDGLRNCSRCNCVCWCTNCLEQGRTKHEEWCHLLKTALEDYKHEKSLGHQVQKYCPTIESKSKTLPASIEILFEKDVAKLVSNKLPGKDIFKTGTFSQYFTLLETINSFELLCYTTR